MTRAVGLPGRTTFDAHRAETPTINMTPAVGLGSSDSDDKRIINSESPRKKSWENLFFNGGRGRMVYPVTRMHKKPVALELYDGESKTSWWSR